MPLGFVLLTVVCTFTLPRTCCALEYRCDCQTPANVRGSSGIDAVGGSLRNWSRALESSTMPPLAPESTFASTFSVSFSGMRSVAVPTDFQSA